MAALEMKILLAVYLATAYCLPALLYSCESWSLRYELQEAQLSPRDRAMRRVS